MTVYTVKKMAEMSGVSIRTLHHYDAIGLLKPSAVGDNGYRVYGRDEVHRLQQILFHKTLGLSLNDIAAALDDPAFDAVTALKAHRNMLQEKSTRTEVLIQTIERTLAALTGGAPLKDPDLYTGFEPEKQSEYEQWLIEKYGSDMADRIGCSKKAYAKMTEAERADIMTELALLEQGLAEGLRQGERADSPAHDLLLDRHRAWVAFMWDRPCSVEAYAGLADMYLSHPDFEKRYEQIEPGFTVYLTEAMKAYAARQAQPR